MARTILIRAVLTGAFCSVFAVVVDTVMDMAGVLAVAGFAAVSGFLGSVFASTVLGRTR